MKPIALQRLSNLSTQGVYRLTTTDKIYDVEIPKYISEPITMRLRGEGPTAITIFALIAVVGSRAEVVAKMDKSFHKVYTQPITSILQTGFPAKQL